jgi:hypothetical protein
LLTTLIDKNCMHEEIKSRQKDEATREWRKLHSEKLHSLYSSPKTIRQLKSRRIEVGGACDPHGRGEKSVQGFGGKARRKETTWMTTE